MVRAVPAHVIAASLGLFTPRRCESPPRATSPRRPRLHQHVPRPLGHGLAAVTNRGTGAERLVTWPVVTGTATLARPAAHARPSTPPATHYPGNATFLGGLLRGPHPASSPPSAGPERCAGSGTSSGARLRGRRARARPRAGPGQGTRGRWVLGGAGRLATRLWGDREGIGSVAPPC